METTPPVSKVISMPSALKTLVTLTSGPPAFLFFCVITHRSGASSLTVVVTSRPSVVCNAGPVYGIPLEA